MQRARAFTATPVGRGFMLVAIATACFGFALSANQNIVSNFFEDELGLSGPQFGYITAIREIPGFLLIFLTALFYRMSLPRLTAGAFLLLAIGYGFFGFATSFWTVAPWVIISSMGYHTFLQTQYALGMSLTTESHSGSILGRLTAINQGGALVAMLVVFFAFRYDLLTFRSTFILCGLLAVVAAIAIFRFPHLRDGEVQERAIQRERIVLRRDYRYYYGLSLLDGGRQQIFFSFGLWVLVDHYGLGVPTISAVLLAVTTLSMLTGAKIGRLLDQHGEKNVLAAVNVAYIVALLGYALIDNVVVAVASYVVYSYIFPLSAMGAATYLRKIASADDIAPSLAMGLTMQHAAAVVVPIATGFVLNYVGYQLPFLVAVGFAALALPVTQRLAPALQKSERRIREEAARAVGLAPRGAPTTTPAAAPVVGTPAAATED
ncbi:MAG TPA: MFS transporter [Thermomicrobiales bacterium]|nr:MFS transporter [Thermomicrobiales bacterium]